MYQKYNIPLEAQWSDVDWMNSYQNFEPDPIKFAGLKNYTSYLHQRNQKWVPVIDAGVSRREDGSYKQYTKGKEAGAFIKDDKGELFNGQVWPIDSVFPDFFKANTTKWWIDSLN